ncbi:MAG: MBL fold metallo-hydrolase [Verrucomicrobiota bacterium]|jgi:metallo-beta-lactamase family protein
MKLFFYGADRTTTGSKHLLEVNGQRLLLECGMFQGRRDKTIDYNTKLAFAPGSVDALLVSHAHIDHTGIIPVLCRDGFKGKIFATDATTDLCRIMLVDSAHIQEQDAAFLSKKLAKKGQPPVAPLYTQADATAALDQFVPVAYHQPVPVINGVTATWIDAGHILGSSIIVLDIEEGSRKFRLAFSGDLGRGHNDILRDPEVPRDVDYLITESTYGNRVHEPLGDVNERICRIVNRAIERRGKIIIPSFAVGRTQQLLYTLYQLQQSRCIPDLPIYVDSPLAVNATTIFRRHLEAVNDKFAAAMRAGDNPFSITNVTYVQSVEESMALNELAKPCIILSASGMAEAGRIRHHLHNTVEDKRNTILIVGWCAQHTLGARLASGDKKVNIFGEAHTVRAEVETIDAFSGHADKNELRAWAEQITGSMRGIIVVHGEEEPANAFAGALRQLHPTAVVSVPTYGDAVEL